MQRRQLGVTAFISLGVCALGGLAAFAQSSAGHVGAGQEPELATSAMTITAMAPAADEWAGDPLAVEGTAPFGYAYVVYFPVGSSDLTPPARDAVAAIADEVTGLELSHVTLTNAGGPDARTQVVRDALIALGVPARWIGEEAPVARATGPVSMAPLSL